MFRKSIVHILISALVLLLVNTPSVPAQSKTSLQQEAVNAGVGAYLEIKLKDGSKVEGRIEALEPTQVVLTVHNSSPRSIRYDQMAEIKNIHRKLYRAKGQPDVFLVRQAVEMLGVGEHVMVRTAGQVIRRGNIKAIDAEQFTIRLDTNGEPATIQFREVYEIHENPHVILVPLILIGVGIAVAAVIIALVRKPAPEPFVSNIAPKTVQAGKSVEITIKGNNFATGDIVSFKGGKGPAPTATNVTVQDANTITATVTTNSGGPAQPREWDVVVTNSKRKNGKLKDGFVVTP
jgi:ribosome maturation factor RimP